MAFWLADEHQIVLTRDSDLLASGAVDDDGNQLELVCIRPGEVIPERVVDAVDDVITSYLECAEDGIYVSQFGYPPLPLAWIDGRRRPDDFIPSRYLGHPVFWLPDDVLRWQPDEIRAVYCIRLCMELTARGVMNPETGDVVDVLVANGLDYRDPTVASMLGAWQSGEGVPELDELILDDPADLANAPEGKQWSAIAATGVVRDLMRTYHEVELEDLNGRVIFFTEMIESASRDKAMAAFESAGKRWFASRRSDEDEAELRDSVTTFLVDHLREVTTAWFELALADKMRSERCFDFSGPRSELAARYREELEAVIRQDSDTFIARADALINQVLAAPAGAGQPELSELWNYLAELWIRWVGSDTSACHEIVTRWIESGPVSIDEFHLLDPPEMPSGAGGSALLALPQ